MPFDASSLSERLPTPDEAKKAKEASVALARSTKRGALSFRVKQDGAESTIELPPAISDMVIQLLLRISRGESVTLVPYGANLTTQQAADILNVSRPYLVRLLQEEKIPHVKVGSHRRVLAQDIFKYKHDRDASRRETLRKLAVLGQEIDGE
jgi:excisionase family DNA binding protein